MMNAGSSSDTHVCPHQNAPTLCLHKGVTLIELLTVLSIVAIIGAAAVPSLGQLHRNAGRSAAVNDFMHSIFLARSRAIMTNGVVSICRSVDGVTCANRTANWESGWIVFQNLDHDQPATRDSNEEILERHGPWPQGRITSNRDSFSFRPTSQGDVNGTVVFCALQGAPNDARAIIISHTGRPRVSTRDANNHALQCL
jgi:type IV fimbrial biogenesis protein FimT